MIVITDWGVDALLDRLESVLALGPQVALQHRHPDVGGRQFLAEAERLQALCARFGNPLFINGRMDVALLLGTHLHLPAHGFLPADARLLMPPSVWISAAVHNSVEVQRAAGADFALVSPVFGAGSKPNDARTPLGVSGFHALAAELPCPAYALGGLNSGQCEGLPRAAGFAVISGVLQADNPRAAAERFLQHQA